MQQGLFLGGRWFSNRLWQAQVAAPKAGTTTGGAPRPLLTGFPKISSFRQSSPNLRPLHADQKKFAEQNSSGLELSTISARKIRYHRNCAALNTTADQNNSGLGLSTISARKIRYHRNCAALNTTADQNNSGLGRSTISAPKLPHRAALSSRGMGRMTAN